MNKRDKFWKKVGRKAKKERKILARISEKTFQRILKESLK